MSRHGSVTERVVLMYKVFWKSPLTGATGALSRPLSRYLAEFRLAHERHAAPQLIWWVEPVAG
ncbi:hypothetical protein SAMN05421508_103334 [Caenispirillum bisanense]|uniref:Uncharacterized protein n=1 Tax=Caenispirillum bisanense TaxID=414052 RepID=A0A286GEW4_9PROT|nr:hypothetical protein SAMN05421508_103334 [Caenispirillum bisanense]